MKKTSKNESGWIRVFSTSDQIYAEIIKAFLESAKVRCSLYRNETFNAYPKNTMPTDEVEVMVRPRHFIKAVGIIAKLLGKREEGLFNEARSHS